MRLNAVLASALFSSATFLGHVRGEEFDDTVDIPASAGSEGSTVLLGKKPTFTVRLQLARKVVIIPQL